VATTHARHHLDDLQSSDPSRQNRAFQALLKATDRTVSWAYEIWDDLLQTLVEGDNRQRSIAAQVLGNLAKSDPAGRMLKDVAALLEVTKDERFVTARHCLQSLWKVGVAGDGQRTVLMKGLAKRFRECVSERNCTLIRYDILVVMRGVYDLTNDEAVRTAAAKLMALEPDPKYQKKYATVWRARRPSSSPLSATSPASRKRAHG
jgi:hypothetical protein